MFAAGFCQARARPGPARAVRPFTVLSGPATLLPAKSIDTDTILPVRFLEAPDRQGLGAAAFHTYRFGADGSALPDSPFNRPDRRVAPVIIAGENFGCGPAREHALWALDDLGVRAIISPRFADMFSGNAFKSGLLLIELPQNAIDSLIAAGVEDVTIDLAAQTVSTTGWGSIFFDIDPFRKACLLAGRDDISLIERGGAEIAIFGHERERRAVLAGTTAMGDAVIERLRG
jgi:3-isopropylmalate/(R)-2-methylmalate dehydratase small subunit